MTRAHRCPARHATHEPPLLTDGRWQTLVEGFDLDKSPMYTRYTQRMKEQQEKALARCGTQKLRKSFAEMLVTSNQIDEEEATANTAAMVVDMDSITQVDAPEDGCAQQVLCSFPPTLPSHCYGNESG